MTEGSTPSPALKRQAGHAPRPLVSDLDELRTGWCLDRINIIGHSWGGLLAMYYVAKHPHVAAAREEYFRIVAFDEVTARNMVQISGPAQAIKRNIAIQHELGSIDCPTLVVHGDHDFIVRDAPDLVCDLIADARLVVIPDSGHYPFIEQPGTFTTALRAFISETRPSG